MAATQNSVIIILLGLVQPIILIIAIALGISMFLSARLSKFIIKPIDELDLDNPEDNEAYEELTPLLKKLTAQNKTIKQQIAQAEQSREEFKLICENMSEGLLVIDRHAKVLSYNNAALHLLEITEIKDNNVLTFNRANGFRSVIQQ